MLIFHNVRISYEIILRSFVQYHILSHSCGDFKDIWMAEFHFAPHKGPGRRPSPSRSAEFAVRGSASGCGNWFAACDAAPGAALWARTGRYGWNGRNKRPYPVVSSPDRVGKL